MCRGPATHEDGSDSVLENGNLNTSQQIIEIVAMNLDALKSSAYLDHGRMQSLEIQYYMIRIHLVSPVHQEDCKPDSLV